MSTALHTPVGASLSQTREPAGALRDRPLSHLDGPQQRFWGFSRIGKRRRLIEAQQRGFLWVGRPGEFRNPSAGTYADPLRRRETNRAFPAPDSAGYALLWGTGGPTAPAQSDPPRFALAGTSTLAIPSDCIPIPSAGRTARSTLRLILHCLPDPTQSHPPRSRRGIRCTLPKRESSISWSKGYHIAAKGCRRNAVISTRRHSCLRPGVAGDLTAQLGN